MIIKLTKAQEKQIPKYIEKYIGLAGKKTDRKKATIAVQNLYKNMGEEKPIVIFGQSPFSTVIMNVMCKILFKEENIELLKDGSQLYSQLYSQLDSQLDSQLYSQLRSQLRSQLYLQLDSQLRSQLRSQLYLQLDSQLDSQLRSQLDSINNSWYLVIWWLVWAGWYSFGKYIGVKFNDKKLKLFNDFVKNISFIIPYKGIAFVSETPIKIHWENNRLHNKNGLAVEYADGYGLYSLHGVKFTKEQFEQAQKADIGEILSWKDIDQRSAILQDKPLTELLKQVDKKLIDKTKECGGYELWEIELKDIGKARLLSYKGWSGGKPYVKFVPPEYDNALEAVAKLRHQTVEELKQSIKS